MPMPSYTSVCYPENGGILDEPHSLDHAMAVEAKMAMVERPDPEDSKHQTLD